jgi:hypothetical protein
VGPGGFIDANSSVLIVITLGLAVVLLVVVVILFSNMKSLRRPFREMAVLHAERGTAESLEDLLKGVDENRDLIRGHAEDIKMILKRLDGCHSGIGLVKYNAFEEVGGMQSYSLCVVTRERNGYILTNLVGRNSTRGYALDVADGKPSRELSDEERQALEIALKSVGV